MYLEEMRLDQSQTNQQKQLKNILLKIQARDITKTTGLKEMTRALTILI